MAEGGARTFRVVMALAALAAVGVVAWWATAPEAPADGPRPVVWDKAVCAHCRMHLGEPHFAAQTQAEDGQVYDFDDPGCLFAWEAAHDDVAVRVRWFHHVDEDRWVRGDRAGFVEREVTPMGYGLGAVDAAVATLTLAEARARVLRREAAAGGSP